MHAVDVLTRCALVAKDGDRLALDQLVEGTYEQVWRLCSRLVDEQSADDLAQDAFVRAIRALPASGARPQPRHGSSPSPAMPAWMNCG